MQEAGSNTVSAPSQPSEYRSAYALIERRFDKAMDAQRRGDTAQATFPRAGSEAIVELETRAATLQWVLEILPPVAPGADVAAIRELLGHISDVLDDEAFDKIDVATWNAVSSIVGRADLAAAGEHVTAGSAAPLAVEVAPGWSDGGAVR
jgi:hypothetical protein